MPKGPVWSTRLPCLCAAGTDSVGVYRETLIFGSPDRGENFTEQASMTNVVHVIIDMTCTSVTTGTHHGKFDIVYMSLMSVCIINSLSTEIMWTLERSEWGCCAAITTMAMRPKKMKARELTSLTSLPSGNCTSVFKHSWQDSKGKAIYYARKSALLGI